MPEGDEYERGVENLLGGILAENQPGEGRGYTNSGRTESPNQDEPKEAQSKTRYNQNGKI